VYLVDIPHVSKTLSGSSSSDDIKESEITLVGVIGSIYIFYNVSLSGTASSDALSLEGSSSILAGKVSGVWLEFLGVPLQAAREKANTNARASASIFVVFI
jgi:hypothetical protein